MGRVIDPQESAFLQMISTAETKEEEADARLVMADWCDDNNQIKRGQWFRTTANLMLIYRNIIFSKRVGYIDCSFGDWFGKQSRKSLNRKRFGLSSGHFEVSHQLTDDSAGPVIASMLPLRRVKIDWNDSCIHSYPKLYDIANYLCCCIDFSPIDMAINKLAISWARYIASSKMRLLYHYQQMRKHYKPLPRNFSLHDKKDQPYYPLLQDAEWEHYIDARRDFVAKQIMVIMSDRIDTVTARLFGRNAT